MDQWKKNVAAIGLLAGVYFLAGKFGLTLAFIHPGSTAVWPPVDGATIEELMGTADRVLYELKRLPRKGMHSRNWLVPD